MSNSTNQILVDFLKAYAKAKGINVNADPAAELQRIQAGIYKNWNKTRRSK